MGKQVTVNENRQYFSVSSRNNGVSLPTVTGPLKKIGTLGLFFRKVSYFFVISCCISLMKISVEVGRSNYCNLILILGLKQQNSMSVFTIFLAFDALYLTFLQG